MRIGAIVQARMGSSRLPGKVLHRVMGRPLLGYLLDRLRLSRRLATLVVATSTLEQDRPIRAFAEAEGIAVFTGSEDDVLDRYYRAAEHYEIDPIVRITVDCPLMDPKVVDLVIERFLGGDAHYVSNTAPLPATYPDGMDVEVFSFAVLQQAWREAVKPSEREHVTFFLWQQPERFKVSRVDHAPDWSEYRLTVDYPEDVPLVETVLKEFLPRDPGFGLAEIIRYLEVNPAIKALNAGIKRNQGWTSAFEKDRQLGFWEGRPK
jgi:spore coat polysaccharide biosynthesis protein SpsF